MNIYETMKANGVEVSNWCSDLYVPVTKESTRILDLKEFELHKKNSIVFNSNICGEPHYDIPFAYQKYHDKH